MEADNGKTHVLRAPQGSNARTPFCAPRWRLRKNGATHKRPLVWRHPQTAMGPHALALLPPPIPRPYSALMEAQRAHAALKRTHTTTTSRREAGPVVGGEKVFSLCRFSLSPRGQQQLLHAKAAPLLKEGRQSSCCLPLASGRQRAPVLPRLSCCGCLTRLSVREADRGPDRGPGACTR